jgi:hypothetical protein
MKGLRTGNNRGSCDKGSELSGMLNGGILFILNYFLLMKTVHQTIIHFSCVCAL